MIAPSALREFVCRSLDEFDWMKSASPADIDEEYNSVKVETQTAPMLHQKVCLLIGTAYSRFLFFLDCGTGKSKIALDLIRHMRGRGCARALVLVPNRSNIETWLAEARKHQPSLSVAELTTLEDSVDVSVALYSKIVRLATTPRRVNGKQKWVITQSKLDELCEQFDGLILDESTAVKNTTSLTFRVCKELGGSVSYCYGLTGTPHGRDAMDLWGQFRVVDGGETLGAHIGLFREALFAKTERMRIRVKGRYVPIYDYTLPKANNKVLNRMVKHRSIRYEASECIDLPAVVESRSPFVMGEHAREQYGEMLSLARQEEDGERIRNSFTAMRQVASGFRYITFEDEDREAVELDAVNERLEALSGLVESIPGKRKLVVFFEFLYSGGIICDRLTKDGVKCASVYSGSKNLDRTLKAFADPDNELRALVVNNKSGSFGLNLQVANYLVFYETPVSPIVRKQASRRIIRHGQDRSVFVYDIVARNSIDLRILQMLQEGKNLLEEIINGRCSFEDKADTR